MKKTNKLFKTMAILLALVMTLAMSVSSLAATITVDDGSVTGATYSAYKILDVTAVGKDANNNDIFTYGLNSKYTAILQTVTGKTDEADIIDYISALTDSATRTFADAVYREILKDTTTYTPDATTTTNEFTNLAAGYYLVAETSTGSNSSGDIRTSYSLVMLKSVNDTATVNTKESVPHFKKEVWETHDSTYTQNGGDWQDGADYDIGDDVPFKLTASDIPAQYSSYTSYKLVFHDTLSDGLAFDASSVTAYVIKASSGDELPISSSDIVINESPTDGCTFEITINDLKTLSLANGAAVSAGDSVVVEYTAELLSTCVIGSSGNPNTAYLQYSNNPYSDGLGQTATDKVIVFTYQLVTTKVEGTNYDPLNGAGFTLYKWYATSASSGDWKAVGSEIVGTNTNTFNWTGLDAGEYKLVETTVPDGYTKAEDVTFTITATYSTTADNPTFGELQVTVGSGTGSVVSNSAGAVSATGTVSMTIKNTTGGTLPETGGMGTRIFYTLGGILAAGALILLITKRRMSDVK